MSMGPNVKRLIAEKMATDAIPPNGGLADALSFLSSKESIASGARKATDFVRLAILAVRNAAEPNPWKNRDDEAIAGELLRRIDARRKTHRLIGIR